MGKGVRRVIPSCVVNAIRKEFPAPDGIYVGYKNGEEKVNESQLSWCFRDKFDLED